MNLLAVETSCDETAFALCDLDRYRSGSRDWLIQELVASQAELHDPYGGVVPELAAREHLKSLPLLFQQLDPVSIDAIAVTRGPGLKGSLLVGISFARALAFSRGLPLIDVNHIEAHLLSGELSAPLSYPYLSMVVSGGHTFLAHVEGFRRYSVLADTLDDAAGEAFDKSASLLDLPYPGGPALSALAIGGDPLRFKLPVPREEGKFSFSGLKTAILRLIQLQRRESPGELSDAVRRDIAASVQHSIVRQLIERVLDGCRKHPVSNLVLSGGVAANSYLQATLAQELSAVGVKLIVPERKWCTDNAAMIGLVGMKLLLNGGEFSAERSNCDALPRWPIRDLPRG